MGNDGGRIGRNTGISGAQIERYGSFGAASSAIPLKDQHRHAVRLSAAAERRNPALAQGRGHQLNAGRGQANVAQGSRAARLGYMRSRIADDMRNALTSNVGRAGNVRTNNTRMTVLGSPRGKTPGSAPVRLNNMTRNVYAQVSSNGSTAAQARGNLGRALRGTSNSAGFSRVPGTATVTRNPNGTYTARVNGIVRGSAATNQSFSARTQGRTGAQRRGSRSR